MALESLQDVDKFTPSQEAKFGLFLIAHGILRIGKQALKEVNQSLIESERKDRYDRAKKNIKNLALWSSSIEAED